MELLIISIFTIFNIYMLFTISMYIKEAMTDVIFEYRLNRNINHKHDNYDLWEDHK